MTSFWKEIHRLQGTTLSMSTAYHPQTNGQSEALNKCVEQYLRCFVADSPHEWSPLLPWAEYWYNTALQAAAGMTPFQALYGREPPTIPR
uniref:Putative ovule protein n=1 Tax=Solanum chacoense TaxID=4108 RepID=A0A0V0GZ30_SOLCH